MWTVIIKSGNGYTFTDNLGRDWHPSSWQALEWLFGWLRKMGRV